MTDCVLGCWKDCPHDCPCDCHRSTALAPLPAPGEVIKSPYAELAVEKVAPEQRQEIVGELINPARGIRIRLPDPFTGVEMPAEVDMVNHPPHYTQHPSGVECIDITRHMAFTFGNAFKYVFRAPWKNGRQDIEKAEFYLVDTLDNANPIFLPTWGITEVLLLDRVGKAETDPNRIAFFHAVHLSRPMQALEAVREILGES